MTRKPLFDLGFFARVLGLGLTLTGLLTGGWRLAAGWQAHEDFVAKIQETVDAQAKKIEAQNLEIDTLKHVVVSEFPGYTLTLYP